MRDVGGQRRTCRDARTDKGEKLKDMERRREEREEVGIIKGKKGKRGRRRSSLHCAMELAARKGVDYCLLGREHSV